MSILNTSITKQPLKVIEVPLNKFTEEVIPHHQSLFEQHKTVISKLISHNNLQLLRQEVNSKKHVVKQLKDLMYELDTLRAQVEDTDLDKFDRKTLSFRKIIINLISGYTDIDKRVTAIETQYYEEEEKRKSLPFEGASQIQVLDNLNELKLKQQEQLLNDVENVQKETEDLKDIFTQLNEMVEEQRESVDVVEEQVESAQENVQGGLKELIKAHKLRTAVYPVTGAFLGTIIGGPIGLVAGLKVGGLTALGCAIAGYTGGKFFKKKYIEEETEEKIEIEENSQGGNNTQKKDI